MTMVPYDVPRAFEVEGSHYGMNGTLEALRNSYRAGEFKRVFAERYLRSIARFDGKPSANALRCKARMEEYERLEKKWFYCAVRTLEAAVKRCNHENYAQMQRWQLEEKLSERRAKQLNGRGDGA